MIKIEANIKLVSPNVKLHYMTLYKRNKKISTAIRCLLNLERHQLHSLKFPMNIRITRFSKKVFDWDNFVYSCKAIRDTIADFIIPGRAPGQADSSENLRWEYIQEKIKEGKDKLRVEIF